MSADPFTDGDASVAIHADTCGTNPTHPGHCTIDPPCRCWCHYGPVVVVIHTTKTAR